MYSRPEAAREIAIGLKKSGVNEPVHPLSVSEPARSFRENWKTKLIHVIYQNGLIDTAASMKAMENTPLMQRPRGVFLGIGLCSGLEPSKALPLDTVGYLLIAEAVRKSLGARSLEILIADAHAISCGVDRETVENLAEHACLVLSKLRTLGGFESMNIVKASEIHLTRIYRSIFETVKSRSSFFDHPYFTREAADIEFIRRQHESMVKIGWTMGCSGALRDERAFDDCYKKWVGNRVAFVYTKPGRILDDAHSRGAPYIEVDLSRRICIQKDEDVGAKLNSSINGVSDQNTRAVRSHIKAVCRLYSKMVEPLTGTVEERAENIIQSLAD